MTNNQLTPENYNKALNILAVSDPDLSAIVSRFGPPPMWSREPGFPTLVHIILEQQVSLASAKAAFERLLNVLPHLTPHTFLTLDDNTLKEIGFSRQKTHYCRILATAIEEKILSLDELADMTDNQARLALESIKGIGRWTSDIYLLMALKRPDIWPAGDLALVTAIMNIKNLEIRPTPEKFEMLGEPWKPWRAVAARLLWHYYLSC